MKAQAQEAYAALSNNNTTLTFYYDNHKSSRNGMSIGPFANRKERGWYNMNITSVVFDDSFANAIDITSTAWWFDECEDLSSIVGIGNLRTDNVTDMTGMFVECENLTSLDLSSFNTQKVMSMRMMFAGCEKLTNLYISSFNTENVIEMWSMFEDCKKIQSIDVSSFNTSNVKDMRYMFADCDLLNEVDISNFNTCNVINMRNMFAGDDMLTTIYVSETWNTELIDEENGQRMFNYCSNLVGGSGTRWDEKHIDYTYAHVDGGASNPGYLTYKKYCNPTVIKTTHETFSQQADCYNLNGIKLSGNSSKGIYLRNGKKYVITGTGF